MNFYEIKRFIFNSFDKFMAYSLVVLLNFDFIFLSLIFII